MAKPEMKKTLQQFDEELKQLHISGQWLYEGLLSQCIGGAATEGRSLYLAVEAGPGKVD